MNRTDYIGLYDETREPDPCCGKLETTTDSNGISWYCPTHMNYRVYLNEPDKVPCGICGAWKHTHRRTKDDGMVTGEHDYVPRDK